MTDKELAERKAEAAMKFGNPEGVFDYPDGHLVDAFLAGADFGRAEGMAELTEMTALKDKAAEIAIAIGYAHNKMVKERDELKAQVDVSNHNRKIVTLTEHLRICVSALENISNRKLVSLWLKNIANEALCAVGKGGET